MADIGVGLRALLVADTPVAAIAGTRIYPRRLPQGATLPAVVYHKVGGADETGLAGLQGVGHQRFQVDAYATTKLVADQLATAIRDAMCGTGRGDWGTEFCCGCSAQGGARDDEQSRGDGSDEVYHITIRDYLVSYVG